MCVERSDWFNLNMEYMWILNIFHDIKQFRTDSLNTHMAENKIAISHLLHAASEFRNVYRSEKDEQQKYASCKIL